MSDISKVISEYFEIDSDIKRLTVIKESLRQEISNIAKQEWEKNDSEKSIKHVHIPNSFLDTQEKVIKHIEDNFITWNVMDCIQEDDGYSVFLEKKPEYCAYKFEDENFTVRKDITHGTPKINWDSLSLEYPEVAKQISRVNTVETLSVDEEEFKKFIDESQDAIYIIERHLIEVSPTSRVIVRKVKK
jgi:hypothetical protein